MQRKKYLILIKLSHLAILDPFQLLLRLSVLLPGQRRRLFPLQQSLAPTKGILWPRSRRAKGIPSCRGRVEGWQEYL